MKRIFHHVRTHKKKYAIASLLVAAPLAFMTYQKIETPQVETKYVTSTVQKEMFITSLSGSGQVASQSQLDLRSKAGGTITSIAVKNGQTVKAGDMLMTIDDQDARKTVRDAQQAVGDSELSLQNAQLSLAKLKKSASASALQQANDALNQAKRDLAKLQEPPNALDLQQAQSQVDSAELNAKLADDNKTPLVVRNAYDNSVLALKTTEQALKDALAHSDNILGIDNTITNIGYKTTLSVFDSSQLDKAEAQYQVAKSQTNSVSATIDNLALQNEDAAKIDAAIDSTNQALNESLELLDYTYNVLTYTPASAQLTQSSLDQLKSTISSDRSSINSRSSALISQKQTLTQAYTSYQSSLIQLQSAKNSLAKLQEPISEADLAAAQEKITERQQALDELNAGADAIDIKLSENSVLSRRSALTTARNKLADAEEALQNYQVRAPFDFMVAKLQVQMHDQASSGGAIATVISNQKMATLSLNEVDVAKVKVSQKATLTFDAIDGLSISGEVAEVSTLGTASQGVVSYDVKILFDTQDERVKSGMSVNASIITFTQENALVVPNSAIKSSGGQSYVLLVNNPPTDQQASNAGITLATPPVMQAVTLGAANDTVTILTEGLNEGQTVVTKTIDPSATKTTAATGSSSLGGIKIPGVSGGGGAMGR
ncbi:MAG: efflux RND transporter periplasmic adaptor subunit [Patescibacteria group bacterium]|jgi:RND family efflux transporter MFP subunit